MIVIDHRVLPQQKVTFKLAAMHTALIRLGDRIQRRDLHHILGRFRLFRRTYSQVKNAQQYLRSHFHKTEIDKAQLSPNQESSFTGISLSKTTEELQQNAVSFGLSLPSNMVNKIYQFACETPCREPGFSEEFYASEVQNGQLKGERHAFRGLVQDPLKCPTIKALTHDPTLLQIVRNYLNYWPTKMTCHLSWSFAVDLPESEQKKIYPPLNCHYDVAGYNFMTAYFYITDIDVDSGAHVMIQNSHNRKPLSTLFVPGADPNLADKVLSYYGADSKLTIEGKAGFGFVQDPSCFHWLLPPKTGRRLLFQIRYA